MPWVRALRALGRSRVKSPKTPRFSHLTWGSMGRDLRRPGRIGKRGVPANSVARACGRGTLKRTHEELPAASHEAPPQARLDPPAGCGEHAVAGRLHLA